MQYKPSENTIGKGEIAHNEQFVPFQQFFYLFGERFAIIINCCLRNSFTLEESKICHSGMDLKAFGPRQPVALKEICLLYMNCLKKSKINSIEIH